MTGVEHCRPEDELAEIVTVAAVVASTVGDFGQAVSAGRRSPR